MKLVEQLRGALIVRADFNNKLKTGLCITDAKSLYDSLEREAKGKEARVALAVATTKQSMIVTGMRPRWIPHNDNIVDGLTKTFAKANLRPLMKFMKTGKMLVRSETTELEHRKELKASGTLTRDKNRRYDDLELNQ